MYVCTLRRYYDRVYFRSRHLEFEPLGSAYAPNSTSFKNGVFGQNTCIEDILKSYKNSKTLLDVFIQKLHSKIYKMCSISGIKRRQKKVVQSHNGPFPNACFRRSCNGSVRNVQAVRNIDFSYFINLIRNSSTLRPLELDVQPMFCRFSSANELEHMSDRSMLVLYPASAVVSSVVSSCCICELILKVHKISFFKEYNLVCLLWKSQI